MRKATLVFIEEGEHVYLGEKKRGEIGTGALNGPGGKQEEEETLPACAVRETKEEWDIDLAQESLSLVAIINFYAGPDLDFKVYVYRTPQYAGVFKETADTWKPERYPRQNLPFERMFESDREWIGKALSGELFCANVYYRSRAKDFDRVEFLSFDPNF